MTLMHTLRAASLSTIRDFQKKSAFPLFVSLDKNGCAVYTKLRDAIGILVPSRNNATTSAFKIDYSWRGDWTKIKSVYPGITNTTFHVNDIRMYPAGDVPKSLQDPNTRAFLGFAPNKVGQAVAINIKVLKESKDTGRITHIQHKHLQDYLPLVGAITRVDSKSAMVAFAKPGTTTYNTYNIPIELLIRLPDTFKQFTLNVDKPKTEKPKVYHQGAPNKKDPKFNIGDVVRADASCKEKTVISMVGIITKVESRQVQSYRGWEFDYEIDFGTLPTRNLLLCGNEPDNFEFNHVLREYDISGFNKHICTMPQLLIHQAKRKRDRVWSCYHQNMCEVNTKNYPETNNSGDILFEVKVADKKFKVPHHALDYIYDPERLAAMLKESVWTTLAFEAHGGNQWAFMYVGMDHEYTVHYRIKLGRVNTSPSIEKKFNKFLLQMRHPWHVHRYLVKKSLGYFYEIMTAEEFFSLDVPDFEPLELQA